MDKILLVDGHSLVYRAFYGQGNGKRLTAADGTPTGAIYTFLNMLLKYIDKLKPSHICVLFDTSDPTFRTDEYVAYKANRSAMPDDLVEQMPYVYQLLDAMNIKVISKSGYEADDLIGTLAKKFAAPAQHVYILSGDRDDFQLLDENISQIYPHQKGKTTLYTPEVFTAEYGLVPEQVVDLKALMGDSADNIPGVKGIGFKRAAKLLQEYESLDNIYQNLENITGAVYQKLKAGQESAYISYELAKIDCEVEIDCELDDIVCQAVNPEALSNLFIYLGFNSMLDRFHLSKIAVQAVKVESVNAKLHDLTAAAWADLQSAQYVAVNIITFTKNTANLTSQTESLSETKVLLSTVENDIYLADLDIEKSREILQNLQAGGVTLVAYDFKPIFKLLDFYPLEQIIDLSVAAYLDDLNVDGKNPREIYACIMNKNLAEIDLQDETTSQFSKSLYPEQAEKFALTAAVFPCLENIRARLADKDNLELARNIEFPLVAVLARMEKTGVMVDRDVLSKLSAEFSKQAEDLSNRIYLEAGKKFNINSAKQLADVLFQDLGIESKKKTSTGQFSTAASVLEELAPFYPIVADVLAYRQVSKLQSTFTDGLAEQIAADGRIHTTFHQKLTSTGRLSSSDPNLQNIPSRNDEGRQIRRAFVAREGYKLVDADYSQIELRLLAVLADEPELLSAFKNGRDIHRSTAASIFGIAESEVSASQRQIAKTVNFSIIYGISAYGLSQDLGISVKSAQNYIDAYYRLYSNVEPYMQSLIDFAYEHGYVKTYFNRRRYIPELKAKNYNKRKFGERAAMNAPIQGTAADIMKLAMIEIQRRLEQTDLDAQILIQVHDEVILEVKETEVESVINLVRDAMETVVDFEIPLKVGIAAGDNWYESK